MLQRPAVPSPLARCDGLLVEQVGAETVIFDTESREAHCLSPVAAAVFEAADGRTGTKYLAAKAASATGEEVDEAQVEAALVQLEERGLLAPPANGVPPANGISRRGLVRRTAAATAAVSAVPMITSIVTPAHAITAQASCPGSMCASDSFGGKGDDYCGCVNTCPPVNSHQNVSNCQPYDGQNAPFYGSCECEQCPHTTAYGNVGGFDWDFDEGIRLCEALYGENYWLINKNGADNAANWNSNWPKNCTGAQATAKQFGCDSTSNKLDGVCACDPGDSTLDCTCAPT